jgi:hypothetical protein
MPRLTAQGAGTPTLAATPFQIELPLEWIVDVDQAVHMGPAQLSTQCVGNVFGLEHPGNAQHVTQVLATNDTAMPGFQFACGCSDGLPAVSGTRPLKYLAPYALTDGPVQQGQCRIDRGGQSRPRVADQHADVTALMMRTSTCNPICS